MRPSTMEEPIGWLKTFQIIIDSSSAKLYNNGKQQVAILLTVEPLAGEVVTEEQLSTLTIVEYADNGEIIDIPTSPNTSGWWMTDRKNKYDYYPEQRHAPVMSEESNVSDAPGQAGENRDALFKHVYVMTSSQGGSTKKLRVQITKDADHIYTSSFSPTGEIELISDRPPVFSPTRDYDFERFLVSGDQNTGNVIYEYRLNPSGLSFVDDEAANGIASMQPTGMIRWDDKNITETFASHVGYAGVDQSDFIYNTLIKLPADFEQNRMARIVSQEIPGVFAIVLQGDRQIPYDSASANQHAGPCLIQAFDTYGNLHKLTVSFTLDDRFKLELK